MIRFLCVILLLSLPTQAFAELGFDKMGGYLRVGDILFRIPKTQKISSSEPWPGMPDPQKPEPVDTGDPDIATAFRFSGVDAASFAGSYVAEEPWGSSWIDVRVRLNSPLMLRDDWCAYLKGRPVPGISLTPILMNGVDSGYLGTKRGSGRFGIYSKQNRKFFGNSSQFGSYDHPNHFEENQYYSARFPLSLETSLEVRFQERDVKGTTLDAVMGNIEKAVRSWVVSTPFSNRRFIAEQSNYCKP